MLYAILFSRRTSKRSIVNQKLRIPFKTEQCTKHSVAVTVGLPRTCNHARDTYSSRIPEAEPGDPHSMFPLRHDAGSSRRAGGVRQRFRPVSARRIPRQSTRSSAQPSRRTAFRVFEGVHSLRNKLFTVVIRCQPTARMRGNDSATKSCIK
jgi:hypothetical protein